MPAGRTEPVTAGRLRRPRSRTRRGRGSTAFGRRPQGRTAITPTWTPPGAPCRDASLVSVAAAVAERQHLALASWQLRWLGVSAGAVADRVHGHGWSRPYTGVLFLPGPDTPLRRLSGAVLAYARPTQAAARVAQLVGRGATTEDALVTAASSCGVAVGGGSAAWLRNLRPTPPRVLCIRVAPHHHVVRRPGVDLRPRPAGATVQTVQGLPVLDVLGTVADCAAAGGEPTALHHELTRLVVTADALRLATPDDHAGRLARHPRGRGGAALRAVLADLAGSLSHSGSEARARRIVGRLLDRRGLLLHPRPLEILLDGRRVAEADLPCVQQRDGRSGAPEGGHRMTDPRGTCIRPLAVTDPRPTSICQPIRHRGGPPRGAVSVRIRRGAQGSAQVRGSEGTKGGRTTWAARVRPRTSTPTVSPSATAGSR